MTIICDTRERPEAIKQVLAEFDRQQIKVIRSKMWVGDYQRLDNPMLVIDRKHNLSEVCNNVVQEHRRFTAELQRAKDAGIHVIILIEHSRNIRTLDDVVHWVNPRLKVSPMAVSGERLYRILRTIENHYGCEFRFCEKKDTGKRIIEILGGTDGKDGTNSI